MDVKELLKDLTLEDAMKMVGHDNEGVKISKLATDPELLQFRDIGPALKKIKFEINGVNMIMGN